MTDADERMKDGEWALLHARLDDAAAAFAQAERIATDPRDRARSLEGQSTVFIARGDFERATELLTRAVSLAGESTPPSTWGNLGFALDKLGRFGEALAAHRSCVAAHVAVDGASHPRTLRKLGETVTFSGKDSPRTSNRSSPRPAARRSLRSDGARRRGASSVSRSAARAR